eukprot:tig00020965_g16860.t1
MEREQRVPPATVSPSALASSARAAVAAPSRGGQPAGHPSSRPSEGAARPIYIPSADERDESLTFGEHMVAGAVAGTVEHIAMFPVDTIKTRLQVARTSVAEETVGMLASFRKLVAEEGLRRTWRGVSAMAAGAAPAHAIYFATYEAAKIAYGGDSPGHHPLATGAAGATATVVQDAIMTPCDVVKQRMQLGQYRSITNAVSRIAVEEGVKQFWVSYPTTLVMNVPFTAIHFASYESCRTVIAPNGEEGPAVDIPAGAFAGCIASGLTNPLDVIKTRLQTQGPCIGRKYHGMADTARSILREEGARAFWAGAQARMLFHTPAAAICWSTYEFMKRLLGANDRDAPPAAPTHSHIPSGPGR